MTTSDIISEMVANAKALGYTNQMWSDASKVPKATIDRIVRGDTQNPSIQTILDMAAAVDYTFSNIKEESSVTSESQAIKDPMVLHLINVYENRGRSYEERIKRNTAHFNMLLAEKNRWLKFSLTINVILIVFLCGVLILDVLHPDIGWIREQLSHFASRNFGDALLRVRDWFRNL